MSMATPATGEQLPGGRAAEMVEVLQAATRVLAGVALRSLDVLDGAVSLPQFRVLAVLADLGVLAVVEVADALGLDASTVTRLADRLVAACDVLRGGDPGNRTVVTLELDDLPVQPAIRGRGVAAPRAGPDPRAGRRPQTATSWRPRCNG